MKHRLLLPFTIGLTVVGSATLAANCAQRETVVERLETRYSEHLVARGLQSKNALMEIFGSATTGTYTVLITNPQGVSCVVGTGTDLMFEDIKPQPAGTEG